MESLFYFNNNKNYEGLEFNPLLIIIGISLLVLIFILKATLIDQLWMNYIGVFVALVLIFYTIRNTPYFNNFRDYMYKMPTSQKMFFVFLLLIFGLYLYFKAYYYIPNPSNNYLKTVNGDIIGNPFDMKKEIINRYKGIQTISDIPQHFEQQSSYSFWLKICPKNFVKGMENWWTVLSKGSVGTDTPYSGQTPGVFLKPNSNTLTITVDCENGPALGNAVDINEIPLNEWFCITIVLEQSLMSVYINGELINELVLSGTIKYNGGNMRLGVFYGFISYLRVYGTALDSSTVMRKYLEERKIIDNFQKSEEVNYSNKNYKRLKATCYEIE